jgi:hypothetical protein
MDEPVDLSLSMSLTPKREESSIDTFRITQTDINIDPLVSSMSGFMSSIDYSEIRTPLKFDESPLIMNKPSVMLKNMSHNIKARKHNLPTPIKEQEAEDVENIPPRKNPNQTSISNEGSTRANSHRTPTPNNFLMQSLSMPAYAYCNGC